MGGHTVMAHHAEGLSVTASSIRPPVARRPLPYRERGHEVIIDPTGKYRVYAA
jgi:hypothetical protein